MELNSDNKGFFDRESIEYIRDQEPIKDIIIAPHADDEILGCGGILGKNSFVYYCGIDESFVAPDPEHRVGMENRQAEMKAVADFLGFKWEANLKSKVNNFQETDFIGIFEKLFNRLKPERVFIPFPSYNQDHRAIYNAVRIALRPHDKNHFVKKVLIYEQPHMIIWEEKLFKASFFIPIDVERKIHAYSLYKSQVRGMRPSDFFRAIGRVRGVQANCEYAEAFSVERWVE